MSKSVMISAFVLCSLADSSTYIGFIAQEIEKVIPEVVSGEDGDKGIAYGPLTAVVVNAIKEQSAVIVLQQKTIDELLRRVERLEDK